MSRILSVENPQNPVEELLSHDLAEAWVNYLEDMWHIFLCEAAEHHPESISKYYWFHLTLLAFFKSFITEKEVQNV